MRSSSAVWPLHNSKLSLFPFFAQPFLEQPEDRRKVQFCYCLRKNKNDKKKKLDDPPRRKFYEYGIKSVSKIAMDILRSTSYVLLTIPCVHKGGRSPSKAYHLNLGITYTGTQIPLHGMEVVRQGWQHVLLGAIQYHGDHKEAK